MMQAWQKLAARIDAMTLRERAIIFAMIALILVTLVNMALLDPLFARQKQLAQRIKQDQAQVAAMQMEMQQRLQLQTVDPDGPSKARLDQMRQKMAQMQANLQGMQKGLVSPDKMPLLLEDILKQNGKLRLVSVKTLPTTSLGESANTKTSVAEHAVPATQGKSAAGIQRASEKTAADAIFRHGVEIAVQGNYLDMLDYLTRLESMPWQLYWGSARLDATDYSKVTLTLTLYTLSLDKEWLNI